MTKDLKDIGTQAAEQGLLASLLYKPDKIVEIIDELNPELFSVKEFSIIYKCIVDLWKEDIIPDDLSFFIQNLPQIAEQNHNYDYLDWHINYDNNYSIHDQAGFVTFLLHICI